MGDNSKAVDILLVEDNPFDAELAMDVFKENKLANHIELVTDGALALDFVFATGTFANRNGEDLPRLIMLDLKLPKVNGLEVLQKIREDPRTRTLTVVMLTSSREEKDIVESYKLNHGCVQLVLVKFWSCTTFKV